MGAILEVTVLPGNKNVVNGANEPKSNVTLSGVPFKVPDRDFL